MPDPTSNVTEEGEPGDLSGAATDEFGGPVDESGARDVGVQDIASDDAGGDALGSNVGRTAGGLADLGVGGQSGPAVADQRGGGAAVIAADDAGAGRKAEQANGSGAD